MRWDVEPAPDFCGASMRLDQSRTLREMAGEGVGVFFWQV